MRPPEERWPREVGEKISAKRATPPLRNHRGWRFGCFAREERFDQHRSKLKIDDALMRGSERRNWKIAQLARGGRVSSALSLVMYSLSKTFSESFVLSGRASRKSR
jgi:hypothetical protein